MTVSELLHNISSEELSYWMAYFNIKKREEEAELNKAKQKTKRAR
jgi:hypothetical protein